MYAGFGNNQGVVQAHDCYFDSRLAYNLAVYSVSPCTTPRWSWVIKKQDQYNILQSIFCIVYPPHEEIKTPQYTELPAGRYRPHTARVMPNSGIRSFHHSICHRPNVRLLCVIVARHKCATLPIHHILCTVSDGKSCGAGFVSHDPAFIHTLEMSLWHTGNSSHI